MAGELIATMAHVDDLSRDLDALDHTLRLFAPGIELDHIPALQSRPKPDWALRGEVVRIVFAILRDAPEPMPTRDLVAAVNRERGVEGEITFLQVKRLRKCLDRQRSRGRIRAVQANGELRWEVAR